MKTLLLILGFLAIAANLFLWYSKRKTGETAADDPASHKDKIDRPDGNSKDWLNDPKVTPLKKSAAAELGISVEQLDRMSVKEIKKLARKKKLI
jgi:FtsZ-interacting cell division protein ZipA